MTTKFDHTNGNSLLQTSETLVMYQCLNVTFRYTFLEWHKWPGQLLIGQQL